MTAVSGTVSLEFWMASPQNIPVTVEIRVGNQTVQTTTVNLGSNGRYTVPLLQPLDYGTYSVTIKASHWLRALGRNVTIPGGTFNAELKNGDATNDNVVDVADLNYVLVRFTTTDPTADLDGSGLVDLLDVSIVLLNFTMAGVPPANNGAAAPSLDGLSGNGRNLLFIALGSSSNPYAPYRVYRKAGGGNYSLVGETTMRLFLDTSATNGTAYTYKACVLNASGGETAFSPEVVLTPTSQNPTCSVTIASEGTQGAARGLVVAEPISLSSDADNLALCMDGRYVAFALDNDPVMVYESERGRNGLMPAVVVVWDEDERYGFSDLVPMTFVNEFSLLSLTDYEINPVASPPQSVAIACKLKEPQNYRVDVVNDTTSVVVRSWTSPAPSAAITYEWDGKDSAGVPVAEETYRFVATLTDKTPQVVRKSPEVEVSRVECGEHRAVIVQGTLDSPQWTVNKVQPVKQACRRLGIPFKVFGYYNTTWDDVGDRLGLATYLATASTRMFYFAGHGNRLRGPSFTIGYSSVLPWSKKPVDGVERVGADRVADLNIPKEQYRFVWIDACGAGYDRASINLGNYQHPASWRMVPLFGAVHTNALARAFGITQPDVETRRPSYYMAYFGTGYLGQAYGDMVDLFFAYFSEPGGGGSTHYTIRDVMELLRIDPDERVTKTLPGCDWPFFDGDGWLRCCPPFYNIRIFTDAVKAQAGYPLDYDGLLMSDMRD